MIGVVVKFEDFFMAKKAAKKKADCTGPVLMQVIDNHCKKRTDVIQAIKNRQGEWFWRGLSADNVNITDTSGEDYSSKAACMKEALAHAIQLGVPLQVWE